VPDMTFKCSQALEYTEARDAAGARLGLVVPGDIRDVVKAPDHHWYETTDEDREALAARDRPEVAAEETGAEGDAGTSGRGEQDDAATQEGTGGAPEAPAETTPGE
jgi:hypothetical protein